MSLQIIDALFKCLRMRGIVNSVAVTCESRLVCKAFGFEIPDGCAPTYTSKRSTIVF